ncbi:hypothetical protein [Streptomyces netropsis]|uniref:Uncharacterized protein n=1 Tax=Streptomyces netropsis TaxID=55404 RepID=A0A7W7LGR0_STRNE|nr:hypothetical protein [Streptomyces netropsis]MBB4889920.1 hypothetical protein [Streptomyces netropsis]GGR53872.1 hypothetical protein GCM10010219_68030 [Streptomyces netropsis]
MLSLSFVVVLTVIVVLLLRTGHLRIGPALAALLLGFCLASTAAAPTINHLLATCASALSKLAA